MKVSVVYLVKNNALQPRLDWVPFKSLWTAAYQRPHLWTGLAWMDVVQSYRRTLLGPAWITLNLIIFTFSMTLIYGALFSVPTREYAAYLACGMIAWFWIAALLTETGNTFITYSNFLKNTSIDKTLFIWAYVFKQVIVLAHHLVVYVALLALGIIKPTIYTLLTIPAFFVLFLLSIPATAVAAILFTRYRDLPRLISSTVIILMMVTPIFWQAQMMTGWRSAFVLLNPIYYLIEFIRAPLLGHPIDPSVAAVVFTMLVGFWVFGAAFYKRYEKYVVFWL